MLKLVLGRKEEQLKINTKTNRRKVGARRYADYSKETLNLAIDLVSTKALSSYEAEKQFGIPRRTILNKIKNQHDRSIGRPQELINRRRSTYSKSGKCCSRIR
ncbi:hypothetical protein ACJJTC_009583 [Scirpophaga incertulas]